MSLPHSMVVLAAGLAWALAGQPAWADMYKWVNDEGGVTFSNTPPRDLSRILEVFPASEWPRPGAAAPPAPAAAQAELQKLSAQVERLTQMLEEERRLDPPQPADYSQYSAAAAPMWDGGWQNAAWYGPAYFAPAPVVVVGTIHRSPHFKKFHHLPKGTHFGGKAVRSHPGPPFRTGGGAPFQAPRGGGRMR